MPFVMDDEGRNEEDIVLGQITVRTLITHCQIIGMNIPSDRFPLTHSVHIVPGDRAVFWKGSVQCGWVTPAVASKSEETPVSAWARLTELES